MSDLLSSVIGSPVGQRLAKLAGLPPAARLRRSDPAHLDSPLVPGPVIILGEGAAADAAAATLLKWGVDVRRNQPGGSVENVGAVIVSFTEITTASQAAPLASQLAGHLKFLAPSARVITLSRPINAELPVETAAVQQGVDGFLRSVAKELRQGATANGIIAPQAVDEDAFAGALRFLLSARSAYVDGQFLRLDTTPTPAPSDWTHPLKGRVVAVTGAARGIGAAITAVLARDGAEVIGVDVPAAGEALAQVMNQAHGTALQLDITAPDAAQRLTDLAHSRYSRLDGVVHNAGILRDKLLANMNSDQWEAVVAVNLEAQLRINAYLLEHRSLAPEGARLVSLASTSGIAGNRGQTNYAFSKAGVIGMTTALAPLLAEAGGTANAVAPGFIETEMTAAIPALTREIARRASSLQQGGQPVDVAEAIAFLLSPQAGAINGQVLRVCGQNLVGQ